MKESHSLSDVRSILARNTSSEGSQKITACKNPNIDLQSGCPWYDSWLAEQIQQQPKDAFCIIATTSCKQLIENEQFRAIWSETRQILSRNPSSSSIDSIVEELFNNDLLQATEIESHNIASHARYLVFAIIGWQTMLFRPDKLSYPANYVGIVDETNGFRGHRHTQLSQSDVAYGKPLHVLLLGFGLMLPPRGFQSASSEDKTRGRVTFSSKSFNAHLLATICDIHLVWTDSLACHLEFDVAANILYIFKYPSFCVANLHTSKDRNMSKSTIHACAKPGNSDALWATVEDINALLAEVLLTYRILFGMEKISRRHFRRITPFLVTPQSTKDKILEDICGRKRPHVDIPLVERDNFDLARDFPILKDRLAPLLSALSATKPRTLRQLWEDRRDSSTWSAFWIILFIGGSGVVLAFIQVVLQIVQIALQSP